MIKAQFEYELKEIRSGSREILRQIGFRRRAFTAILTIFVVGITLPYLTAFIFPSPPVPAAAATQQNQSWLPVFITWAVMFVVVWFLIFRILRKAGGGKDHHLFGRIWTLEADSDLVALHDANLKSECRWAGFRKLVEKSDVLLLFYAKRGAFIIPKRVLSEMQLNEFLQLAQTNIHPKTGGFPVIPLAQRASQADATENM